MQSLADFLAAVVGRRIPVLSHHEMIEHADADPEVLEQLLTLVRQLPSTATIAARIARREERLATARERQTGRGIIATLERWQARDRRELDLARWRDAYLAERRPGCQPWCLGLGVRRVSELVTPVSGGSHFLERVEYCPCADGRSLQLAHEERRQRQEAERQQAAVVRIWDSADIPSGLREYTLESYLALPGSQPELVAKLRRWQASESAWLLLLGAAGLCKTGLAISLLLESLAAGHSGLYVVAPDFLARLRETYDRDGGPGERQVMASAADVELLLLDDVGKVGLTVWGKEKLFTLINRRDVHRRRTIVTTNLPLSQLEEHLDSPTFDRIRGNACDRETGESFVIELTGESRRGLAS